MSRSILKQNSQAEVGTEYVCVVENENSAPAAF